MTFRQQYRSARREMAEYIIISLCHGGLMGETNGWVFWVQVVCITLSVAYAISSYYQMKRAKRYIVFDTFLNDINQQQ